MKEIQLNITKNSKLFALFINIFNPKENFEISKQYFKTENPSDLINTAQKTDCDLLALGFNIKEVSQIPIAVDILKNNLPAIEKPLMICATGDNEIDKILLPELIKNLDRPNCIISNVNEKTYKSVIPYVQNHYVVLKTPIDINLAKELNILCADLGLCKDRIIMNTDIGGLGYGFEYGYSIMEKVRLEGEKGDEFLNLPLISDASIESLKTKEAKTGSNGRARMIELTACTASIAAGANIITVCHPKNISVLRGLV